MLHQPTPSNLAADRMLVIVTSRFLPDVGGVQTHVAETTQQLMTLGWQVVIITGAPSSSQTNHRHQRVWHWHPYPDKPTLTATVIPVHYDGVFGIGLLQIWWQMLQALPLFFRAKVIHVHDVLWWIMPVRLLLPWQRVVLTMHGWEGRYPIPGKLLWLKRLGAVMSDKVMAIGDFIGHFYGIQPDHVSYGAVSPQLLSSLPVRHQTASHHAPKVAFAGRLAADTGLSEILTAIPFLTQFEWHFYGDGPLRSACQRWGKVHGWNDDRPWLREADIVIGSGYLSIWEALLAGKQVVVYADNQLKIEYFARAPFAPYIAIVTTSKQFVAVLKHSLFPEERAQRLERIETARTLAQVQRWDNLTKIYHHWYQQLPTYSWPRLLRQRWNHLRFTTKDMMNAFGSVVGVYLLTIICLVAVSGLSLWYGLTAPVSNRGHQKAFSFAAKTAAAASVLTAQQLPPIELVRKSSSAVWGATQLLDQLAVEGTSAQHGSRTAAAQLTRVIGDGAGVVETVCQHHSQLKLFFSSPDVGKICEELPKTHTQWLALQTLVQAIFNDQLELLVVMQNTQELRPTGGFMGSYARIQFNDQLLPDYEIGDIYEPDGQFQGHISAPAGVDEYLSSGRGLRLPDSNWFPDFPTSAQTILQYFAYGKRQGVDGVVAVNLPVFEKLLQVVGPLTLPDYDLVVTADNLPQVARADRQHFFPGSQQKPHFLTALANQIRFRLESATIAEKAACVQIVLEALRQQDIQIYLIDEQLQSKVDTLGWSGRQQLPASLNPDEKPLYFMSVESNVGINKANQAISRQLVLDLSAQSLLVQLKVSNQNTAVVSQGTQAEQANGMGYVDYQRIFISPVFTVKQIKIGDQVLPSWHEQLIQTDADVTLNQIGFVLPVPVGEERTALIQLELAPQQTEITHANQFTSVYLQKQSGLPAVNYTIQTPNQVLTHHLTDSTLIPLKK